MGTLYFTLNFSVNLKLFKKICKIPCFSPLERSRGKQKNNPTMRFQKNSHLKCWQGCYATKIFTLLVRMANGIQPL